jgi:hypothetical protein
MTLLAELKRCQKCLSADIVQCGIYWKCAQCGEHFPHPLIRAPREMTLAAIQRRFDYGSWDSADLRFLYLKAESQAEMLLVLEQITANCPTCTAEQECQDDLCYQARAAIQKARGEK